MDIFPSIDQRLNPYEFYSKMRKYNPIAYDEEHDFYAAFQYDRVKNILLDFKNFSSNFTKYIPKDQYSPILPSSLITSDPPEHRNLRNSISMSFNSSSISKLEPRIEKIAKEMIDKVIDNEFMDLIDDFAFPLPVTVIAELLGIPPKDHAIFKKWADQILSSSLLLDSRSEETNKIIFKILKEMDSYFSSVIDERSKQPHQDLISELVKSSYLNKKELEYSKTSFTLSREHLLSFCSLLLLAGHVTTVNLIGNAFVSLLENPSEFNRLKKNQLSLIPSTIEETLRYRSPVQGIIRYTTRDLEMNSNNKVQVIPKGKRVIAHIGSANHDELIFPFAEKFDITRNPNPHIAFGAGIHLCIGAPLAKLEAVVALRTILKHINEIHLADPSKPLKSLDSLIIHGVEQLPISFKCTKN